MIWNFIFLNACILCDCSTEEMSQVQMDLMLFSFLYAIENWPNKIF